MSKLYYVKVEDYELDDIESKVRKHIINLITKEITEHSRDLATSILQAKPLIKKKWYQPEPDDIDLLTSEGKEL